MTTIKQPLEDTEILRLAGLIAGIIGDSSSRKDTGIILNVVGSQFNLRTVSADRPIGLFNVKFRDFTKSKKKGSKGKNIPKPSPTQTIVREGANLVVPPHYSERADYKAAKAKFERLSARLRLMDTEDPQFAGVDISRDAAEFAMLSIAESRSNLLP